MLSTFVPGSHNPLRSRADFEAAFEPASPKEGRVGAEWELLPMAPQGRRVPYSGREGVSALLEGVRNRGYGPIREGRSLTALRIPKGGMVGLEPGAQVELASPPSENLSFLDRFFRGTGRLLSREARELGFALAPWGIAPNEEPERLPDVPKVRYSLLADHLSRSGDRGRWMMKLTASTQVALDYCCEEHLRAMTDGLLRALPYLYAATANAPVALGRPTGWASVRAAIWKRTDPLRCGLPRHIFSPRLGYRALTRWALGRPALFFVREGEWIAGDGRSFEEIWRKPGTLGPLTTEDWALHLSGLFPDLRIRGYLEVRVLDSLPLPLLLGSAALLKGLISRQDGFSWTRSFPSPSSTATRLEFLRAARLGARWTPEEGPSPGDVWPKLFNAAREGLRALGEDPARLEPLVALVASGRCPADDWWRDEAGIWRGPSADF